MKILLIEDNQLLAKSIKKGLEHNGFVVEHFADGIEGEKALWWNHKEIDVLLLDLMLPGKTGEQICMDARKKGIRTPIVMLTAKDLMEDKLTGFQFGADDYLTKPFEFAELLARIRAILRRPSDTYVPDSCKIGNLEIDFSARRINNTQTNQVINLSPREFDVLEFLVRHKNQAVSRDTIFDSVSDFAADNWSNTVDVHIKNIRKKLYHKNHENFIQTVRGIGYRLEIPK